MQLDGKPSCRQDFSSHIIYTCTNMYIYTKCISTHTNINCASIYAQTHIYIYKQIQTYAQINAYIGHHMHLHTSHTYKYTQNKNSNNNMHIYTHSHINIYIFEIHI